MALVSVYASTHVPSADWPHSFGLGGLFGDTVLGAILGLLPVPAGFGLKVMSIALAVAALMMLVFVLGFEREELWLYARYLVGGMILIYHTGLSGLGKGATGTIRMAAAARERKAAARMAEPASAEMDDPEINPAVLRAGSSDLRFKSDGIIPSNPLFGVSVR